MEGTETSTPMSSTSELTQLREIVFGDAERQLLDKLELLRQDFGEQLTSFRKEHDKTIHKLEKLLADTEARILKKLDASDQSHHQQSEQLEETLKQAQSQLSSEIEMTDTSAKEDADAIHERVDKEIRVLTQLLEDYRAQAMDKLTEVNHELNNSKTDRKTLAKLLAAMATNLEADESDE